MRRLVDPATASQYAQVVDVVLNASDIVAGKKPASELGIAATDARTLKITLATPAPYLPGLCPIPRRRRCIGRRSETRRALRPRGRPDLERRVRAGGMVAGQSPPRAAQSALLERRRGEARRGEVRADRGRERGAARLPRRRAALHGGRPARSVRLHQGKSRRGAAHRAAAQHLLLRLQSRSAVVQGSEPAACSLARHRPPKARGLRAARGRAARSQLGAAGRVQLFRAGVRLRGPSDGGTHRRSEKAARQVGVHAGTDR